MDELVGEAASDNLAPMEAYVDCSKDSLKLGEEYVDIPLEGQTLAQNTCIGTTHRVGEWIHARVVEFSQNFPNNPTSCTDIVPWVEFQRGTLEWYELFMKGFSVNTDPVDAGTATKSDDPVKETFVKLLSSIAKSLDMKSTTTEVVDESNNSLQLLESIAKNLSNTSDGSAKDAFAKNVEPIEVARHRRIGTHKKHLFIDSLVCEIKAKLGTPPRTKANLLAVRHIAYSRCKEVNLRAVDTRRAVELAVEMVFVADQVDIDAAHLANSRAVARQNALLRYESKSPFFRSMVGANTYAKWSWSQSVDQGTA